MMFHTRGSAIAALFAVATHALAVAPIQEDITPSCPVSELTWYTTTTVSVGAVTVYSNIPFTITQTVTETNTGYPYYPMEPRKRDTAPQTPSLATCFTTKTVPVDGSPTTTTMAQVCPAPQSPTTDIEPPSPTKTPITLSPTCIEAPVCPENSTYTSPRNAAYCTPEKAMAFHIECNRDSAVAFDLPTPNGPWGMSSYQSRYGDCAAFCQSAALCNGFAWREPKYVDGAGDNCYLKTFDKSARDHIFNKGGVYLGISYPMYLEMYPVESSKNVASSTPAPTKTAVSTPEPWDNSTVRVTATTFRTETVTAWAKPVATFTPLGCPEPRVNVSYPNINCTKSAEGWSNDGGVSFVTDKETKYKISCHIAYFHSRDVSAAGNLTLQAVNFGACATLCENQAGCNAFTFDTVGSSCQLMKSTVGLYPRYRKSACTGVNIWNLGLVNSDI